MAGWAIGHVPSGIAGDDTNEMLAATLLARIRIFLNIYYYMTDGAHKSNIEDITHS